MRAQLQIQLATAYIDTAIHSCTVMCVPKKMNEFLWRGVEYG